jgi:hypothetical protein
MWIQIVSLPIQILNLRRALHVPVYYTSIEIEEDLTI